MGFLSPPPPCASPFCSTVATQSGSAVWAEALGKRSVRQRKKKEGVGITARLKSRISLFLPGSLWIDLEFYLFIFRNKKALAITQPLYCIRTFFPPSSLFDQIVLLRALSSRGSDPIALRWNICNWLQISHRSRHKSWFKLYYSSLLCSYNAVSCGTTLSSLIYYPGNFIFPSAAACARFPWRYRFPRGALNAIVIGFEFQINQARIFYYTKIALPAHSAEIGLRFQKLFHCLSFL